MKTVKTFFKPSNTRKFRIARILLYRYLRDWRNTSDQLNFFYHAAMQELKLLNYLLNKKVNSFSFSPEDVTFLRDIRDAKRIKYGNYQYQF